MTISDLYARVRALGPVATGALIIGGLFAALIILSIIGAFLKSTFLGGEFSVDSVLPTVAYKESYGGGAMGFASQSAPSYDGAEYKLSTRNAIGIMPPDAPRPTATGDTAEDFEVMQYSANYETGDSKRLCADVLALKDKDYVIFENSNEYLQGCNVTFKVKKANVEEILAFLNTLKPRDLSQNIRTIKQEIDDYTAETDVLTKKKESIESTLSKALAAYDDVTNLAVRSQNADALSSAINSKIQLIERLTQERISINEQLDRLARSKQQQLDQIDYTFFSVNVSESRYIDWRSIGDSWKYALQQFVRNVNDMVQTLTLGLLALLLVVVQYAIYFFAVVLIAKYAWKGAVAIWNK